MKQTFLFLKAFALLICLALASCATFGIQGVNAGEAREGVEFRLLVKAWDKEASDPKVVFSYRVNGGPWKEKPGVFNGSLYESAVGGDELSAGRLEYFASLTSAKGKVVTTKPTVVRILTFAEAKEKAAKAYMASLSAAKTEREFLYDEPALFRLSTSSDAVPESLRCAISVGSEARVLEVTRDPRGWYEASIPAPHAAALYAYQWTVVWRDREFGEIASTFPAEPRPVPVLDRAAVRARVEKEFRAALKPTLSVAGTFFEPPVVQARLEYGALLEKRSLEAHQVALVLKKADFSKQIAMSEIKPGLFGAAISKEDMELGIREYFFTYADSFKDIGFLQARYPLGAGLGIAYKSYADFREEAVAEARNGLIHQPSLAAIEGAPLSLKLEAKDSSIQIVSAALDAAGPFPIAKGIPFVRGIGAWSADLPGSAVRPGASSYAITVVVHDARLGDIEVRLPAKEYFTLLVKSLADLKREREEALRKGLSHIPPTFVLRGEALGLALLQQPAVPNAVASLFYRTAESSDYRELRAVPSGGTFAFVLDPAATRTVFLRYYFEVRVNDPGLGPIVATLRDRSGGGESDFVVAISSSRP